MTSVLLWWRFLVGIFLRTWRVHSQSSRLGVSQPSTRPWVKLQALLLICSQGPATVTLLNLHWKLTGHRVWSLTASTAKHAASGLHVTISVVLA